MAICASLNIYFIFMQAHVEFTDKAGGIKLEGPPEEVEEAKEKLSAMITEMQSKLTFDQLTFLHCTIYYLI